MSAPAPPAAACAALVALAQQELSLVEADALDGLEAVHAQRLALLDLVAPPGGAALGEPERVLLRDAARLQLLATEAMRQRREELARELDHSGHARRAVAGYRASTAT